MKEGKKRKGGHNMPLSRGDISGSNQVLTLGGAESHQTFAMQKNMKQNQL
jgi:hypothetical protein